MSRLRYLVPNGVTVLGLVCGLASLLAAHEARWPEAGYFIIWAVLLDNLDGPLARLLDATSAFGAQLDSFADFVNFGIAPAALVYLSLRGVEPLGFVGGGEWLLAGACLAWALAAMARLARFNVTPAVPGVLFGLPTTLAAGSLVIVYLAMLKYTPLGGPLSPGSFFSEAHPFGRERLPLAAWRILPIAMAGGAALMISNLPMPRLGGIKNRLGLGLLAGGMVVGYVCNALRIYPEWMSALPLGWSALFLIWGLTSSEARRLEPPPLFQRPPP